jgi:hypothetical protein
MISDASDSVKFAVTNARFASFHGLSVARMPRDHVRSTMQIRALVTSGNGLWPQVRPRFRLRLGGGRCAPAPFPPSLRLRFTVSARRPQTEALTGFSDFGL